MADSPSEKKPSKSTFQSEQKAREEDENSSQKSKAMISGSEKVCQQCDGNDKQLLFLCKRCGSKNDCDVCVTEPQWACSVCCNHNLHPKIEGASYDDIHDEFVKVPDVFNGINFATGDDANHTNGWLNESDNDEDAQETSPAVVDDERYDVGLWKGNDVGEVAKEMLQAVESRFPHTFALQIRSTPYWLSILKGLHLFIKRFLGTSVDALTRDQISQLEAELDDFERFGFDLSWARKRLDMVKNLKFGNDPLRLELLEANARLEKARLDYERAINAHNNKAREMVQTFGAEFEYVLNGNLGYGMLPGTPGYAMGKGTTGSALFKVPEFDQQVTPKVNEVATKPLKVRRKSLKKSSFQIHRDQSQVKQEKWSSSVTIYKRILSSKKLKKFKSLSHRNSPKSFYNAMKCLSMVQKRKIADMGFGSLLEFNCSYIPSKLGYFVVDKFDPESMKIKFNNREIQITPELINHIFGIPNGGAPLLALSSKDSTKDCYVNWRWQFGKELRTGDIVRKIHESGDDDMVFVLNFIILFLNSFVESMPAGTCKVDLLERFDEDVDIKSVDWCGYIYSCLKTCKLGWKRNKLNSIFVGPVTVLMLIYLDLTLFNRLETPINARAITFWTGKMMKERELLEIENGGFGQCEIRNLSVVTQEQSVSEFEGMNTAQDQSAADIPSYKKDVENIVVVNLQKVEAVI